jgi:hypothetical protein
MKTKKIMEIDELVRFFCKQYLNEELTACVLKLCETLGRNRKLDITRGKKEIWAASIVYVIARVNFLFDTANDNFLTADIICDFFGTKKSTIGNKSSVIEKTLNIGIGDKNYSTAEIAESFSFVEMPGGFIVPEKMANDMIREFVIGIAKDDESREIEEFMVEKKRKEEEAEKAKRERQAEINREKEEKKRKKKEEELAKVNERQLKLW